MGLLIALSLPARAADVTIGRIEDGAILPLYWQKLFWAARKGYVVDPDRGEATSAHFVLLAR